jgi:hypothetical protein
MPASRMTARAHVRQRQLVAASLLLVGENPRLVRDLPIDVGTYTPYAALGTLTAGGALGTARSATKARSVR